MFFRIHSTAVKYERLSPLTPAKQLPDNETPGKTLPKDFRHIGFSDSREERRSRSRADTRPEPYRPSVHDGGNVTAKALLIGGCVLAVGVLVLVAVRLSQVSSAGKVSPEPAVVGRPDSDLSGADIGIEVEPDLLIEVPDIATPDNPDAPMATSRRNPKKVRIADASSTDVVSPETEENDESAVSSTGHQATNVPEVFQIDGPIAVPRYNRSNPYAEIQTVDLIDDIRGHRVMASLNEICVHIVPLKSDVRGGVSAAVSAGVRGALERCQLQYRGGISEPIMLVQLDVVKTGDVQSLSMTAMLLVNKESRILKVWQRTAEIGAITNQALQKGILPPKLNGGVSGFFTELRSQFVDVRRQFSAKADD
ncbi:MAG: hypothetical protein GY758_23670 [Fuerstiella sp.]|jgi:hypothetical protein|nr:hypothetical protein [Fuerstiella sp.]MDG2127570.1 hypothetical protein [Fuerstiella sp.]